MDNALEKPVHASDPSIEEADEYVAFPGGIPKKWLNPAFYIFIIVFIGYASWIIVGEIGEGGKANLTEQAIAKSILTHLSSFLFVFTVLIIAFCKVLERLMYYLQAKKRAKQAEQRAERERQRAEKAEQRAEQAEQRIEQEKQRAEQAEQRAEKAEAEIERITQGEQV